VDGFDSRDGSGLLSLADVAGWVVTPGTVGCVDPESISMSGSIAVTMDSSSIVIVGRSFVRERTRSGEGRRPAVDGVGR